DVLWPEAQCSDRRAELGKQLRVSQEGRTHRDNLIVVVKSSLCDGGQVFARSTGACLVSLERLEEGRQMRGHQREEDLLFMIEMPVESAFCEAGLARNLLGRHACQSLQEDQLFSCIQDLLSRFSSHVLSSQCM